MYREMTIKSRMELVLVSCQVLDLSNKEPLNKGNNWVPLVSINVR